jgi:hypothetical protein
MTDVQLTRVDELATQSHWRDVMPRLASGSLLPREVIATLRQRGVASGPVLLVVDESPLTGALEPAPQLQLVRTSAAQVGRVRDTDFVAALVLFKGVRSDELESALAAIATRLLPGAPVVLLMAACPRVAATRPALSDRREATHLMLLRCGYDRVWVHRHRAELMVSARRVAAENTTRKCSIIVPVFNERNTFPELMRRLLAKRLDHLGLEREIILVESNSTDGTRELVAGFAEVPGVRILWQDRPRGKGRAVREALRMARGDIVLIQDADLEYDVNDYDALLSPLLEDRAAFVLGSRHIPGARMRRLEGQRLLSAAMDCGHLFFTGLINVLYGQQMKDPLTMFKVFRRDCLHGLELECDRFDFDHELVIKLVLKGYRPVEIPVSYCSRSFRQGKKIRLFRDPLGWIRADFKYRLQPLRPRRLE